MQNQNPSATTGRMEELDALRGLASFVVMAGHFAAMFFPGMVFGGSGSPEWQRLFVTTPLHLLVSGHFAVCLFFILSGFVLSVRVLAPGRRVTPGSIVSAIARRPLRLLGIVLVTSFAGLLCWQFGGFFTQQVSDILSNAWLGWFWPAAPDPSAWQRIAKSPFFSGAQFNPPLWTIALELYGSWLVFCLVFVFSRIPRWRVVALILVAVALGRLPKLLAACHYQNEFISVGHWTLLQGFVWGMITAHLWHAPPPWVRHVWNSRFARVSWIAIALLLGSVPQYASLDGSWCAHLPRLTPKLGGGYPMIGAVMLFLAVLGGTWRRVLRHRLAQALGGVSYALYGCHFVIQASVCCAGYVFLISRGWGHSAASMAMLALMLVLVLICSRCLTRLVDTPCIRFAEKAGRLAEKWLQYLQPRRLGIRHG